MLRVILLMLTFTAAVWCTAQMAPPVGQHAGDDGQNEAVTPDTQPDRFSLLARNARPLTDELRAEILEFLKSEQPDLHKKLEAVRRTDSRRYETMLAGVARTTAYLMELKRGNPELYSLYKEEMQVGRDVDRLTQAILSNRDPSRQSELVAELRGRLVERFDLVQKRQRLLISQFKQKMDRLEKLLETRQANREKIIEQDIQRIMEQAHSRAANPARIPAATIFASEMEPATQPGD